MKSRLLQHRIPEDRVIVAENWADGSSIFPLPFPELTPMRILYSGNLGLAHDVATIRGAIERLADRPDFLFAFAGGGLARRELIEFCQERGIENTSFQGYVRLQDLGASLAECHIGLVTQKPTTLGAIVPSKVYGLMAAGRPVLYIGPASATPAVLIQMFDCGWHFDCGDEAGVAALLLCLIEDPEVLRRKGQNGREAFIKNYDKPAGVARVLRAMGLETQNTY
jgi:glycosyltransferase involved in cell wall biosynthesis